MLSNYSMRLNHPYPLGGLVHAAGVLDDGLLSQLDWPRFDSVMSPKVAGAWNLHCLTENLPLDFFCLFFFHGSRCWVQQVKLTMPRLMLLWML
ncbi:MAG UNVERIFIED_CONTAM: KR domain-containing protein [Microcystis novacekii LVE1205-3]|jgi:hypothetical protein